MRIDRRQFLKGASASALLAGTNVLSLAAARRAFGATADGRAVVLINFSGGNDYLNTVIPLDDVGANKRSVYESVRPDLDISLSSLSAHADRALQRARHRARAPPADDGPRARSSARASSPW